MTTNVRAKDIDQIDDHPLFRQKLLDKLNSPEQLDQLMAVTSARGWLVLLALGLVLASGAVWALFATIQSTVPASGILHPAGETTTAPSDLEVTLYVSVRDAERIRPGQSFKIAPASIRQEEYGLLLGYVSAVSGTPATRAQMVDALGNDALVQSLIADGLIVEVQGLFLEGDTPSGYRWTSGTGPPAQIYPGTLALGDVIIGEHRPIELVWPH